MATNVFVVALSSYSRGFHFAINCWLSIVVCYLVPGPTPCPEVVAVSYIRQAECQGPSHGGSYMDEGTCHIRIGLPPRIVSGDYLASSSMPPLLFARACLMSSVCDLGVVLVRLIHLVIMCVGARLHGILYPMTGCVLYLDGLLC